MAAACIQCISNFNKRRIEAWSCVSASAKPYKISVAASDLPAAYQHQIPSDADAYRQCLATHSHHLGHDSTMAPSKRPHEVIDLTGDSPVRPKAKNSRTKASSNQGSSSSSTARPSGSFKASQRNENSLPSSFRARIYGQSQGLASQEQDLFDDEPDIVDLTQTDDGPTLGLYGTINNKIVGVRYYNGIVSPGEVVVLRREPSNP